LKFLFLTQNFQVRLFHPPLQVDFDEEAISMLGSLSLEAIKAVETSAPEHAGPR
jgi:hypothetical protein